MGKALIFNTLIFFAGNAYSHAIPDSTLGRFGAYLTDTPPESGFSWNEVTFFPGNLFTLRNLTPGCEDSFGHGTYSHNGDTLILSDIHTWSTQNCTTEVLENIVVPEKRYLYRNRRVNTFEIRIMPTGKSAKPKWILFRKIQRSKPRIDPAHK
jgi:hypothetical protein